MRHTVFFFSLMYVGLIAWTPLVNAQSNDNQDGLSPQQRIERLENRLIAMESRILGESNSGGNSTLMADHEARLQAIEAESSKIYGTAEEVAHAVERLAEKVEMIAQDLNMRLQDIEMALEGGLQVPDEKKKITKSKNDASELSKPVPSDISANQLYNDAYDFMKKGAFASAEEWFRTFTQKFPEHNKAENAYYWLGEVRLVRQKPQEALVAFGESIKNFPDGARAADSLLKMGVSFVQIGKIELAKTTWQKLISDFPNSSPAENAKKRMKELN